MSYSVDMKILTLALPESVARLVDREAASKRVDPASLCATILSEFFLSAPVPASLELSKHELRGEAQMGTPEVTRATQTVGTDAIGFNVRDNFPGVPSRSVELAQDIVNEALKLPGVRAFPNNRGIGFEPNFVFIEYLHERAPGGVMLSLYGGSGRHRNPLIKAGRTDSYSRALVHTQAELLSVLPHVRKAFQLKFG
jgi:hypothetical protein